MRELIERLGSVVSEDTGKYWIIGSGGTQGVTNIQAAVNAVKIRLKMGMTNIAIVNFGDRKFKNRNDKHCYC